MQSDVIVHNRGEGYGPERPIPPPRIAGLPNEEDLRISQDSHNDAAIRLWQIDMAMMHLTRNAGVLGNGGNAVQQALRAERDAIIARLRELGQ